MKLKAFLIMNIVFSICILLTSCFSNPTPNGEETSTSKDDFNTIDNMGPSVIFEFNSLDELKSLLDAAKCDENTYNAFIQANESYPSLSMLSYVEINQMANEFPVCSIPMIDGIDTSGALYPESDRLALTIVYNIDGVQYGFEYKFTSNELSEYKGDPSLTDVKLGGHTINLYHTSETWYVGNLMVDGNHLFIKVVTDTPENISFDQFTFVEFP